MVPGGGCSYDAVQLQDGSTMQRRTHTDGEGYCHDCNAAPGSYHHPGCDWERCPVCGGQIIGCDCDITHYIKRD
jgi:hypothetical protein